jgi:hypothetical protein
MSTIFTDKPSCCQFVRRYSIFSTCLFQNRNASCITGPIIKTDRIVPSEIGPCISHPRNKAHTSIIVRIRPIDQPKRSANTNVKPSRGPVPTFDATYIPAPNPISAIPKQSNANLAGKAVKDGIRFKAKILSIKKPIRTIFNTVPSLGSCRSNITTKAMRIMPTICTQTPIDIELIFANPMCNTSQEFTPRFARIIQTTPIDSVNKPAINKRTKKNSLASTPELLAVFSIFTVVSPINQYSLLQIVHKLPQYPIKTIRSC